jgi:hypothetical protein
MHDVAAANALVRATRWSSRRSARPARRPRLRGAPALSPAPGAPCSSSARCSAFRPARWRSPGHDHRPGEQRLNVARRAHARGRAHEGNPPSYSRRLFPRLGLPAEPPREGVTSPAGADPSRRPLGQPPLRLANAGVGPGVGDALGHRRGCRTNQSRFRCIETVMGRPMFGAPQGRRQMGRDPRQSDQSRRVSHQSGP